MDLRIEQIFLEEMKGDMSFQDNSPSSIKEMLFGVNYTNHEMREIWNLGIKYGIEIGLNRSSLEGQRIELNNNSQETRHQEFLEKFHKLAEKYKCAIQYHLQVGMCVIDREY